MKTNKTLLTTLIVSVPIRGLFNLTKVLDVIDAFLLLGFRPHQGII